MQNLAFSATGLSRSLSAPAALHHLFVVSFMRLRRRLVCASCYLFYVSDLVIIIIIRSCWLCISIVMSDLNSSEIRNFLFEGEDSG